MLHLHRFSSGALAERMRLYRTIHPSGVSLAQAYGIAPHRRKSPGVLCVQPKVSQRATLPVRRWQFAKEPACLWLFALINASMVACACKMVVDYAHIEDEKGHPVLITASVYAASSAILWGVWMVSRGAQRTAECPATAVRASSPRSGSGRPPCLFDYNLKLQTHAGESATTFAMVSNRTIISPFSTARTLIHAVSNPCLKISSMTSGSS